jgi:glucokinase
MQKIIGIDVGGTKIHAALFTETGKLLDDLKLPTEADTNKEKILSKITYAIQKFASQDVACIGIGFPGPIDHKRQIVYPPNIPPLKGLQLNRAFKNIKIPIFAENDANAFLFAEQRSGAVKGYKNVIGITLGTGVGGSIMIDGELYRGRDGAAGEIGHMTIDKDGYLCNCSNLGCLEMYVSGTAIQNRAERHIAANDFPTKMKSGVQVANIIDFHARRDKLAKQIFENTGKYMGMGLVNVINLFNPDIIVLGGSVSKALPAFQKTMYEEINKHALWPGKKVKVVRFKLLHPGAWGAALSAFEQFKKGKVME